ncbi:MAG: acetaldehyde dehydrogenase (acetylating) [Pseudolysinimonas sp.]
MAQRKLRVAIIGTGNIGTDLMYKVERSDSLELAGMAGIDPDSDGLKKARDRGHVATSDGLAGLLALTEDIDLAFDATSAGAHAVHAAMLAEHNIRSVDLTPAKLGPAVVPAVNLGAETDQQEINLLTCGAQATIPIVAAVNALTHLTYAETVSTISSRSAGPGTRQNIDEFTASTAKGLMEIGGADDAKAIIILNPAKPPMIMRNTIYLQSEGGFDAVALDQVIDEAAARVADYVPGYRMLTRPTINGNVATVTVEVEGAADYLPAFAGNLDIMTSAAVRVAELYAEELR